ncbi:MAG: hypothetical protein NZM06_05135 [Chloroherpetonaceae bacterium]|nr:hypothetical protein [Chloroherpetonaceae bacterium]MDW8437944.1 hypothetical protein [Chloroherpetonaceae bacterium]
MPFRKPTLCVLLCLCALGFPNQSSAQALDALSKANLITISALDNANVPLADSVNAVPRLFFQAATLIDQDGVVVSRRAADNTLVSSFEKVSYLAKGVFRKSNALGALSYEIVVGDEASVGRIALYADADFRLCAASMRWRKVEGGAIFSLKRLVSNRVREENLRIDMDGSGFYEMAIERKPTLFLKWDKDGKILKRQAE